MLPAHGGEKRFLFCQVIRRFSGINQCLLLVAAGTLADTLQHGSVYQQRPSFFRKQDTAIFTLFNSED